jgi:hypothetical protein
MIQGIPFEEIDRPFIGKIDEMRGTLLFVDREALA